MIGGHYVVNKDRHDGLQVSSSQNPLAASPFRRLYKLSYNYNCGCVCTRTIVCTYVSMCLCDTV